MNQWDFFLISANRLQKAYTIFILLMMFLFIKRSSLALLKALFWLDGNTIISGAFCDFYMLEFEI